MVRFQAHLTRYRRREGNTISELAELLDTLEVRRQYRPPSP